MAYHVAVGEIEDDHVLLVGLDDVNEFLGNFRRTHLREQVVGRNLRRSHQYPVLVLVWSLQAAVEEEGHVRVFLSLGYTQLPLPGLCHSLAQGLVHQFLVEENMHTCKGCVVWSEAAVVERNGVHSFLRHVFLGKCGGELARTVVAEVVEDDGIAFLYLRERLARGVGHDYRLHELVGDVCII